MRGDTHYGLPCGDGMTKPSPGKRFRGGRRWQKGSRSAVIRMRPLRRSQLISPFGVGAITDFRFDEALMCAGLDAWFRTAPESELRITEERLQARLGCGFFVKPPEYNESDATSRHKIPYVRFPLWHYCPRCFRMKHALLFGDQPRCDNPTCGSGRTNRRMIPVRILAVCELGHIEDFPFREWIGCQCPDDQSARLLFKAGRSAASLAGIKIECEACRKMRSLAGAFEEGALEKRGVHCSGAQPWLGRDPGVQSCPAELRVAQRGGSNVYFPLVMSSIYIPPVKADASEAVERVLDNAKAWEALTATMVDGRIDSGACRAMAAMFSVDPELLATAAQARLEGRRAMAPALTEEDFRHQEYQVLRGGSGSPLEELFAERVEGSQYGWLKKYVESIGLVRKLRETRVLTGFSRLVPRADRSDMGVQPLAADTDLPWLPAIEVRGEGIFMELRQDTLDAWLSRPVVSERVDALIATYNANRVGRGLSPRRIDARFMMIHTLAHAVIKELTFSCGYGSASLRERIYCNIQVPQRPMNGFLVYTASGDSEGTLGGLVAQANPGRFERVVAEALRRSAWCSNDPVCLEGSGGGNLTSNLAACHGCVLLPETSCEEGNCLLDRGLLVGTFDNPATGFFDQTMPLVQRNAEI